jgi:hypothetical protein
MAQKIYDLVVVIGSYLDRQGNQKKEYRTIGAVFQNERGMYAMLDKTFNPLGVTSEGSSIFLNFFEPKNRQAPQGNKAPVSNQPAADFDDEIPW